MHGDLCRALDRMVRSVRCRPVDLAGGVGKNVRAAEAEGQFALSGCCYGYDRVLEIFRKRYPKIKPNIVVAVAGNSLASRILAERRTEKYLVDVVSSGANMLHDALYKAQVLEPIKPALLLPGVLDPSKWYEGEHRYIDPDKRYIFAFVANSLSGQVAYNLNQANPGEFKSYWDLLQPKWKGKTVSLDPMLRHGSDLAVFYSHPDLGPSFIKKLYGDMQITVSRDPRQMTDWLSAGKFSLCIRCNAGGEVGKAMQHKLPIGYLDAEDWKEGAAAVLPAARSASRRARPIPMRRKFSSTGCCPGRADRVAETRPVRRAQFPPHRYSKRRRRSLQPPGRGQEIFRSGQTGVPRPDADIQVGQRGSAAKVMHPSDTMDFSARRLRFRRER